MSMILNSETNLAMFATSKGKRETLRLLYRYETQPESGYWNCIGPIFIVSLWHPCIEDERKWRQREEMGENGGEPVRKISLARAKNS